MHRNWLFLSNNFDTIGNLSAMTWSPIIRINRQSKKGQIFSILSNYQHAQFTIIFIEFNNFYCKICYKFKTLWGVETIV